jgi:chromosome segregation ATPase
LSRAQITKKIVEATERPHIAELEEANAQLQAELAAANAKIVEVENRERALIFDYGSLRNDYGNLESAFAALGKEKEDLEKTEREKAQWFCQLLHTEAARSLSRAREIHQ